MKSQKVSKNSFNSNIVLFREIFFESKAVFAFLICMANMT